MNPGWASPATERIQRVFGVPRGVRTPVAAVKGQCPRPLDDGDADFQNSRNYGGARRDRTADLLHAMQALSQLSYSPKGAADFTDEIEDCQGLRHRNCGVACLSVGVLSKSSSRRTFFNQHEAEKKAPTISSRLF